MQRLRSDLLLVLYTVNDVIHYSKTSFRIKIVDGYGVELLSKILSFPSTGPEQRSVAAPEQR